MSTKDLSTAEVAAAYAVSAITVRVWCRRGLFPNARAQSTPRGPVWMIPAGDLNGFELPKRTGRPKSAPSTKKRATGRLRARNGTSTGKQKGGKK